MDDKVGAQVRSLAALHLYGMVCSEHAQTIVASLCNIGGSLQRYHNHHHLWIVTAYRDRLQHTLVQLLMDLNYADVISRHVINRNVSIH